MGKEKILVYDIDNLSKERNQQHELLVERFGSYLERHPKRLHNQHRHSFFHLVLFTRGAGTHSIDFTIFPVAPFQIYFMIPGQVHSWHFEGETDGYIVNFSDSIFRSFLLNSNYLESFSFFSGISEDCVFQLPLDVHDKVIRLFEDMIEQTTDDRENEIVMTRLLLMQLFVIIENARSINNKNEVLQHKQVLLKNFRRLIEAHYREIKLPKKYADLLFVTPNYLNALSQELLGKTAGELIRDRVLLEAKRLLTNSSSFTVLEIATVLNFQDNSYFTRFFKKYTKVTPDEFRKQLVHYK
ncbi:MAG: helix-turn-helix transcriptional regulator [Chitinophagaceae bacterium]